MSQKREFERLLRPHRAVGLGDRFADGAEAQRVPRRHHQSVLAGQHVPVAAGAVDRVAVVNRRRAVRNGRAT